TNPVGPAFATVTATPADTAVFPAASRARAVSVCAPFAAPVASHVTVHGAPRASAPRAPPSTSNCTPPTPPVPDAPARHRTPPPTAPDTVAPAAGPVIATVGAVGSYATLTVAVPALPAASRAVTVTTFAPGCSAIPAAVHAVVPDAVPLAPRSVTHVTCVTPTLSTAVPATVTEFAFVVRPLPVGEVMLTVGAVVPGTAHGAVST